MELTLDEALQKGVEAHKAGQIQEAERLYTAVLKAQPKHPDANHNTGVLAVGVGKIQEALPFFTTALETNPSVAQFWLSYIDALMKLNRIADAQAVFDQAKDKGASGKAFDQLEQRLSEPNTNPQDPPSDQLQPVIDLYTQGQLQQALVDTNKMLESFPTSVALYNISGACNLGLMKFDSAIRSFKYAIKIQPDCADAYNNMGAALRSKGSLEAAVNSYSYALKIQPDFAEVYNNMGIVLRDKGDLDAALDSYKRALKINPKFAEAYKNMGMILLELGRNEAAEASYKQALILKPDYSEALYSLGLLLLEFKKYEKAAEQFRLSNSRISKYYLLRCLYLQNKKTIFYDELDCLIKAGEVHPMIGSLGCRSALRYGMEVPNLFCKDPLNYVSRTELIEQYDFEKIFINTAKTILNEHRIPNRRQGLLTNGYQTSGNLFILERDLTKDIQQIIRLEIDKYLVEFKNSEEGLITSWPKDYSLRGWLISMKSGGELRPHMHEDGWISGSIYINVPANLKIESGNLVVCIEEELVNQNINQDKSINVVTGSLCLFPASLLHYTLPFESEEERIVLAFDVIPKY